MQQHHTAFRVRKEATKQTKTTIASFQAGERQNTIDVLQGQCDALFPKYEEHFGVTAVGPDAQIKCLDMHCPAAAMVRPGD